MLHFSSAFVAEPELIRALEPRSRAVDLSKNRILFREGEESVGIYIVRSGSASLSSESDDSLNVVTGPGSLLGLPAVVGSKAYSLCAEALDGAEISFIDSKSFVELMQTEPQLSFQVLKVLAEEVRFAREVLTRS